MNEGLFYKSVRSVPKVTFIKGHRSPVSGKGIDMRMGIDLVKGAILHEYKQAIIMTGDSDLTYAVDIARKYCKSIHAAFLRNRYSPILAYRSQSAVILKPDATFYSKRKQSIPRSATIIDI